MKKLCMLVCGAFLSAISLPSLVDGIGNYYETLNATQIVRQIASNSHKVPSLNRASYDSEVAVENALNRGYLGKKRNDSLIEIGLATLGLASSYICLRKGTQSQNPIINPVHGSTSGNGDSLKDPRLRAHNIE